MKQKLPLILLACSALSGVAVAQDAAPKDAATPPENGASLNFAPAAAPLESLSYEQTRQMFRVRELITPTQARANVATLADTVVEMQGEVVGMMATAKGRVFMMRVDNALATFAVSKNFQSFEPLRSGAKARILVEVGDDAGFTIVAATSQLLDPNAPVEPENPEPVAEITPELPHDDVVIIPPMVTMTSPSGQASRNNISIPHIFTPGTVKSNPGSSRAATRTTPAPSAARNAPLPASSGNLNNYIMSQKPAYQAIVRRYNNRLSEAQVDEIATALLSAGHQHRLDPRFLAAVVAVESNFNIYSRSRSGAMGLGQLMPFKAAELGVSDPYNPTQNLYGMARTLRTHLDTFSRFGARGPLLAVAAYNAGPNAVKRAGYNVPPGDQVQRYVWKVYYAYKSLAPDMFK